MQTEPLEPHTPAKFFVATHDTDRFLAKHPTEYFGSHTQPKYFVATQMTRPLWGHIRNRNLCVNTSVQNPLGTHTQPNGCGTHWGHIRNRMVVATQVARTLWGHIRNRMVVATQVPRTLWGHIRNRMVVATQVPRILWGLIRNRMVVATQVARTLWGHIRNRMVVATQVARTLWGHIRNRNFCGNTSGQNPLGTHTHHQNPLGPHTTTRIHWGTHSFCAFCGHTRLPGYFGPGTPTELCGDTCYHRNSPEGRAVDSLLFVFAVLFTCDDAFFCDVFETLGGSFSMFDRVFWIKFATEINVSLELKVWVQ